MNLAKVGNELKDVTSFSYHARVTSKGALKRLDSLKSISISYQINLIWDSIDPYVCFYVNLIRDQYIDTILNWSAVISHCSPESPRKIFNFVSIHVSFYPDLNSSQNSLRSKNPKSFISL